MYSVGGFDVTIGVAEGVEDNVDVGVVVTVNVGLYDATTGSVVSGCIFHACGVSVVVCVCGSLMASTLINFCVLSVDSVDAVTSFDIGFEASIGLMCTKVGIV